MFTMELKDRIPSGLKYKFNVLILGNDLCNVIKILEKEYLNIYVYDIRKNDYSEYEPESEVYSYDINLKSNNSDKYIFFDYIIVNSVSQNEYIKKLIDNLKFYMKNGTRVFISIKNEIGIKRLLKKFSDGNMELTNLDINILKNHLTENNFNISNFKYNFYNCSEREKNIIEELCSIIGNKYNSDEYMIDDYFIESIYLDKEIYESDDMINLKYMIIRIDNGYHINNFSDVLIELFKKYGRELIFHLEYLVMVNVINKERIIDKINCKREMEFITYLKYRLNLLK